MRVTLAHLACIALGAALHWLWARVRRPARLPATRRQIDRAARAGRPVLRVVRGAHQERQPIATINPDHKDRP